VTHGSSKFMGDTSGENCYILEIFISFWLALVFFFAFGWRLLFGIWGLTVFLPKTWPRQRFWVMCFFCKMLGLFLGMVCWDGSYWGRVPLRSGMRGMRDFSLSLLYWRPSFI